MKIFMSQILRLCFFVLILIGLIIFPLHASAQDCTPLTGRHRQAVVSLTIEFKHKETGAIATSYGTGFIVTPEGYVLTAKHVVTPPDSNYEIRSIKGAIGDLDATVQGLEFVDKVESQNIDIALLRFKDTSKTYSTVPIGKSRGLDEGQKLCSLSFSAPLGDDYHMTEGILSNKQGEMWTTRMQSNKGESGAPVFRAATGKVVAIKLGTIIRQNVNFAVEPINYLTPIHLANSLRANYFEEINFTDDPPQRTPPVLLCNESSPESRNPVEFRLDAVCNGCTPVSKVKTNWEISPFKANTEWNTAQAGWLSASASVQVELKCYQNVGNYALGITTQHSSLAGWGGIVGDYRFAESSIVGSATTGFSVGEEGKFCLSVKKYTQEGSRRKGYPGSYLFPEGEIKQALIKLESPTGDPIDLSAGNSIVLDKAGLWKFRIQVNSSHRTGWAEDSGHISLGNLLEFRFGQKLPDGTCPVL